MKNFLLVVAALLFFSGGGTALFWLGSYFSAYVFSAKELQLNQPTAQVLSLGTSVHFDLYGDGFDRDISVSLSADVNNSDAIIGSYPLEGVYNVSLRLDDLLYLASDEGGVQVLDIEEPRHPKLLKEYLVGRTITDIHHHGNYFYLSCGEFGVVIMQILPDGLLSQVANMQNKYRANESQFVDGFLYVVERSTGLQLYDVRQPEQIKLVKAMKFGSDVSVIKVAGNHLYLARGEEVLIYDVGVPQMPQRVGSLTLSKKLRDLIIQGGKLYVATENGVSLYSLKNPVEPKLIHLWEGIGSSKKLYAGSEFVYVSDYSSGFWILDSTELSHADSLNLTINPRALVETPDYLLVAGFDSGLLIVDRKVLLGQQAVKRISTSGIVHDIFTRDRWMFTADTRGGVSLHDLNNDGGTFTRISSSWGESFVSHNELLFVAQSKQGVQVFDISTPGQPVSVATWVNLQAMRLAVVDKHLVIAKGHFGVDLVDISDLSSPLVEDSLSTIHVLDVASAGGLIYIASKDKGLLIYEIDAQHKFRYLGSLLTPFPMSTFDLPMALQVQNNIVYIANGRSGLLIVDVTNPEKPAILSTVAISGTAKEVKVVNGKAFIASHQHGIVVVNIEDPKKPVVLNNILIPGVMKGLQVVGNFIYVPQRGMGVTVIQTTAIADKINLLSPQHLQVSFPSPKYPGRYNLEVANPRASVVVSGAVIYQ